MRRFAFLSILLFSCGVTNRASALYLSFGCTDPALSTDITYEQTGSLSFNRIVEVANPSQTNISILSWQTEYKLNPIGGASGQLSFTAVATPPSPVLTNFGGPQTTLTVPSDYLLAFDANIVILEPTLIPAGERRNIMEITITASPDASGDFQLVTPAFSPPDVGSTWFPDLASGPGPFENTLASGQAGSKGFTLRRSRTTGPLLMIR